MTSTHPSRFAACASILACLVSLTACGSDTPVTGTSTYAFEVLRGDQASASDLQPESLQLALPNHVYTAGDEGHQVTFSDDLITGKVTDVTRGSAVVWGLGEDDYKIVDWDDKAANARSVIITLDVDTAIGADVEQANSVAFRLQIPVEADHGRFMEGLRELTRLAVLLRDDPSKIDGVSLRPALGGSSLGVVSEDGALSFPRHPDEQHFMGPIQTVDQLTEAAMAPPVVSELPGASN